MPSERTDILIILEDQILTAEYTMLQNIFFDNNTCPLAIIRESEYEVCSFTLKPGDIIFKGDKIMFFKNGTLQLSEIYLSIDFDAIVTSVFVSIGQKIKLGTVLFEVEIRTNEWLDFNSRAFEFNKPKLHNLEINLLKDDFTDKKTVSFSKIAGQDIEYFKTYSENSEWEFAYLGITFINHDGFAYIQFLSREKDLKLSKNDNIILLFENDVKISYTFENKGVDHGNNYYLNYMPLNNEDLKIFSTLNLKKIKLTSSRNKVFDIYHLQKVFPDSQYKSEYEAQYLLKYITNTFIQFHINNQLQLPE